MTDNMVGTWKGDPTSFSGVKEFWNAVGIRVNHDLYTRTFTLVVTKEGNSFHVVNQFDGVAQTVVEDIIVGQTVTNVIPGMEASEDSYTMEGNKLISKRNYQGKPVIGTRYVEGNTLVAEEQIGHVKTTMRLHRA